MASVSGREVKGSVIRIDEEQIRGHVDEVVRSSVEETLNGLLDAEADRLCQAKRYGRGRKAARDNFVGRGSDNGEFIERDPRSDDRECRSKTEGEVQPSANGGQPAGSTSALSFFCRLGGKAHDHSVTRWQLFCDGLHELRNRTEKTVLLQHREIDLI